MKYKNLRHSFNLISVILVLAFAASNVLAANNKQDNDKTVAMVITNLAAKLKREMAPQEVSVDSVKVEKRAVSKNEISLSGKASCFIKETNTTIPIEFEARFDASKQMVEEVKYTFIDSRFTQATEEDFLTQHLLNQISKDENTKVVVIAINTYETRQNDQYEKEYTGSAEVRIGQLEWRKISFDVVMTDDVVPSKIKYTFIN